MKKMLQNFGSILSILFFYILFVTWQWLWQDYVMVWQNTPCTVYHAAMACLPHWSCWRVLPDGVIEHIFFKNGVILHACVHGRRKEFFLGGH